MSNAEALKGEEVEGAEAVMDVVVVVEGDVEETGEVEDDLLYLTKYNFMSQ